MAMDAYPARSVTQRKRSYSTTAYSSQEEESLSNSNNNVNNNSNIQTHSSNCLAVAVGSQVLTYEYRNTGTDPVALTKSQQLPIATPGQYEGIQISNERVPTIVSSLKWSPDNTILAVEAQDGRIFLNDNRGRFQEFLVNDPISEVSKAGSKRCAMSWAPKPQRLYFAMGNKVMTWDSTFKRTAETFEMASRINTLSVNADDILLAAAQNSGSLDVVNRSTGVSAKMETPASLVLGRLEYSFFSRSILGGVGNDGILRLWDTGSNGSNIIYHSFTTAHESPIGDMAFSPFNRYLICTAGLDKRYALYDVEKKKVVKNTMADYPLTSVSFKNDGISMAFGTDDGKVLLYDLRSTSRPISVTEAGIKAPVTAIQFQGKQSSMKRHQTMNGTLKRQSSSGSQSSVLSAKDSIVFPVATSSPTETLSSFKVTTNAAKHSLSRMATLSHPTNQATSNGASKMTKESLSSSVPDLFSPRRSATTLSSSTTLPAQDEKLSFKPRRPVVSTSVPTTSGQTSASSNQGTPKTSSFPSTYPMPTTPTKERTQTPLGGNINNGNASASNPNSRTASPFSFQMMQSRSPSAESSSSTSSVNHSPPGSPGMEVEANAKENNRKHHHYQYHSSDSLSKSPSRASRAKRRKSFGSLMASGGVSSITGTPDPMSEEKVEMLRGQLVDKVRDVILDRSTKATGRSGIEKSSGQFEFQFQKPLPKAATGLASSKPLSTSGSIGSKPKAPISDLWMQAGKTNSIGHGRSITSESTSSVVTGAGSASSLPSATAISSDSFSSKILENVIEGCLMDLRAGIRNDIQNMHLELLRQFQIQKVEIEGLLKKYADVRELQEENERLIEENRRLRMNF